MPPGPAAGCCPEQCCISGLGNFYPAPMCSACCHWVLHTADGLCVLLMGTTGMAPAGAAVKLCAHCAATLGSTAGQDCCRAVWWPWQHLAAAVPQLWSSLWLQWSRKHRRWMPLEGNTTGADRRSRRGPWEELCPHPQDGTSSGVCTAGMERAGGTHPLQPWGASPAGSGHMAMELPSFCSHPLWFVLALLLGMLLWATRRRAWDPRKCPTDLTGKTVIVTGANSGIGKCVAMDLARRNARTILACRSRERGQAAAEEIRAATGNPNVVLRLLDSSSLASVRAFAREVLREEKRLDVLVNNAGVTGLPFALTPEGLERTFATNYLGPFLLTNLLLDLMKASAPARIVTVSSFRHSAGTADCRFLTGRARPDSFDHIYNSTKLMNVLHTAEMAQRLQGTGVTANSLNPGVVSTGIMRNFSLAVRGLFFLISPFIKSAEQGAVSTIYCAVSEEVSGISGKYFDSDCSLTLPSAAARDAGLARKLWEESERLTGLSS
ncbi:retinol dehydrogenase 12 isoform X1 [Gallus gallus]|uniref:retinol dehydrogenase 12 isoform X1 n=2 Tax=Gallus gallus TaxID=9031 RepID=UPI001AE73234|nr:retinol dehydrogenase 12 isoform X1 [Gallus gallus]